MILKILRYSQDADWWMFDDIKKVSKTTFCYKSSNEVIEHDYDVFILDTLDKHRNLKPNEDKEVEVSVLVCRMGDGTELTIAFDTLAYLCNDSGKTIEKIVANYNEQ